VLIKTLYTVKFLLARGGCPEVPCNILFIHKQGRIMMDLEVSLPPGFSCRSISHNKGPRDALDDCTVEISEGGA
jgi:hypothetical protein